MEEKISAGYSTQKLPDGPTSQSMYGRCYRCGDMGPYEYGIIYVRMCIDDVWKSVPVCARCWNKYHASDAGITSRQIAVKEHNKFVAGELVCVLLVLRLMGLQTVCVIGILRHVEGDQQSTN